MATLTTNISNVSLTVSGRTTKSTTISWTRPTVPSSATISSCKLTGTATASMSSGSATITVNGTTVTSGRQFTINLGTNNTTSSVSATARGSTSRASGTVTFSNLVYTVEYSIPTYTVTFVDYDGTVLKTQTVEEGNSATAPTDPVRSGYTFIGWDKSFSNITSNLTVTAQYTAIVISNTNLRIKENGNWTPIKKVYRNIYGVWSDISRTFETGSIFDTAFKYVKKTVPTAILYEDGTLLLSNDSFIDNTHGAIVETYSYWVDELDNYLTISKKVWYLNRAQVLAVNVINPVSLHGALYETFYDMELANSFNLKNLNTSNVTAMPSMFRSCSSLTSLDLSNFDTGNVTNMNYMFEDCSSLTFLNISSFDMSNVTATAGMFSGCTNPNLVIYVKDEATKTKIESSSGFPSTATVVIGKPN